jgi:predicted transcriptional regulator
MPKRKATETVPPPLHELESEVMEDVWERGESTVRDVMEALNAKASRPRAYTTYMTIMARLHRKGLLTRRRGGRSDCYAAVYDRAEYARRRARSEVEQLVAQYGDVALSNFAEQIAGLDPARRRALQRLAKKD